MSAGEHPVRLLGDSLGLSTRYAYYIHGNLCPSTSQKCGTIGMSAERFVLLPGVRQEHDGDGDDQEPRQADGDLLDGRPPASWLAAFDAEEWGEGGGGVLEFVVEESSGGFRRHEKEKIVEAVCPRNKRGDLRPLNVGKKNGN